ncbi:MAG: hypothetical protein LBV21_02825 [Candidatus Adiutrix sp.]|nr:hypothetical protein [Candidatus Adiutrix sp.]
MKAATAIFLILAACATTAGPAGAQPKDGGNGPHGPIAISSDRLETDDAAGVVNFMGAVVARQGGLTLTCDLMKVFYTSVAPEPSAPEPSALWPATPGPAGNGSPLSPGRREIDRVEGFGHVKMVDGDHLAVGDHALYLAKSEPRRLIITGDARVWQGRDSLTGHKITYFLDERRSLVESESRQRVRTVIHDGPGRVGKP